VPREIDSQLDSLREGLYEAHSPFICPPVAPAVPNLTSSPGLDVYTQNCIPIDNHWFDFC
jgi:hypothetical protein